MTFAQYQEQVTGIGGNLQFTVTAAKKATKTSPAVPAMASLHTYVANGDPVYFSFNGLQGLPAALLAEQNAVLRFNSGAGASTTAGAQSTFIPGTGTVLTQAFNNPFTISFTRTTAYIYKGVNYGTNLLTITLAPEASATPSLTAVSATKTSKPHSASLDFDNSSYLLTYSSSFIKFPTGAAEDGSISFSGSIPYLAKGATFLNPFRADSAGTFDSDPPPVGVIVPISEPVSLAILGSGLLVLGLLRSRA